MGVQSDLRGGWREGTKGGGGRVNISKKSSGDTRRGFTETDEGKYSMCLGRQALFAERSVALQILYPTRGCLFLKKLICAL